MNPQVLGNLTALASQSTTAKAAALKAQQMAKNAQSSVDTANSTIAALTVFNPQQIRGAVPLGILPTVAAWSNWTLGSPVPQAAKWVTITGYAYFSTPDNADVELDFRSDKGGATFVACRFRSVLGVYSGNAAINVTVPVGPNGTIQYQIVNGSYSVLSLSVVAWA